VVSKLTKEPNFTNATADNCALSIHSITVIGNTSPLGSTQEQEPLKITMTQNHRDIKYTLNEVVQIESSHILFYYLIKVFFPS
jgi:hypothetical protein